MRRLGLLDRRGPAIACRGIVMAGLGSIPAQVCALNHNSREASSEDPAIATALMVSEWYWTWLKWMMADE